MHKKFVFLIFSLLGLADSIYLTLEHYSGTIPPCAVGLFVDCGRVLRSEYAVVFGLVPLAVLGLFHYGVLSSALFANIIRSTRIIRQWIVFQATVGMLASLYFVFLQLVVIRAICLYCMVSAVISFTLFGLVQWWLKDDRIRLWVLIQGKMYQLIVKPILFSFEPEVVHENMVRFGELSAHVPPLSFGMKYLYQFSDTRLTQEIHGIDFVTPIGLAAGFDYNAQLTQSLVPLNFGFQSVGTITNQPYQGNPPPRLGRLPQSKSLMVNKGYKNLGIDKTLKKLTHFKFPIPVGISIGVTNDSSLNVSAGIEDIIAAFSKAESSSVTHSYYELNISCPNLQSEIDFYDEKNLSDLLTEVDRLHIKRPLFIKMPISVSDSQFDTILKTLAHFSPRGVIIGNLQKDKNNPAFVKSEVSQFTIGNFSGKPTFERSNELISKSYKQYKDRFTIIGCGGVFSAQDALEKMRRGASLVQLITGMIFMGPQLITEINLGLLDLIERKGIKNVSELVGKDR